MQIYGYKVNKTDEGNIYISQETPCMPVDEILLSIEEAVILAKWILKEAGENGES